MAENVGGRIKSDIEKGNPWHEPGSGKFADAPPGVNLVGESLSLLKVMQPQDKRAIDDRLKQVSGDTLEVRQAGHNQVDVGIAGDGGAIGFRMELGKGEEGISMEQKSGDEPDVSLPETVDETASDEEIAPEEDMDVPAVDEVEQQDVDEEVVPPEVDSEESSDEDVELPEMDDEVTADLKSIFEEDDAITNRSDAYDAWEHTDGDNALTPEEYDAEYEKRLEDIISGKTDLEQRDVPVGQDVSAELETLIEDLTDSGAEMATIDDAIARKKALDEALNKLGVG